MSDGSPFSLGSDDLPDLPPPGSSLEDLAAPAPEEPGPAAGFTREEVLQQLASMREQMDKLASVREQMDTLESLILAGGPVQLTPDAGAAKAGSADDWAPITVPAESGPQEPAAPEADEPAALPPFPGGQPEPGPSAALPPFPGAQPEPEPGPSAALPPFPGAQPGPPAGDAGPPAAPFPSGPQGFTAASPEPEPGPAELPAFPEPPGGSLGLPPIDAAQPSPAVPAWDPAGAGPPGSAEPPAAPAGPFPSEPAPAGPFPSEPAPGGPFPSGPAPGGPFPHHPPEPAAHAAGAAGAAGPFDGIVPMDLLAAASASEGGTGALELQQEVALTSMREQARAGLERSAQGSGRKGKKSKRRGGPDLWPVSGVHFRDGDPLIVTFTSPKGGSGKSTTAANYAAYVAESARRGGLESSVRVLLVDGDVANGILALRLAKRIEPNMLDLLNHMDKVRAEEGRELSDFRTDIAPFVLAPEGLPNLDVLAAPDNPEVLDQITQQDLEQLRDLFARHYQVIVFDAGTQITEHTNCAWMYFARQVFLMVEPELTCLHKAGVYVERAKDADLLSYDRCRAVMIRADVAVEGMDPREVISSVFSYIPPDRAFFIPDFYAESVAAASAGELLALEFPEYADSITPIVRSSLEDYEADGRRA